MFTRQSSIGTRKQGHWQNLLNLEFEPAIGHVGERYWGEQEAPIPQTAEGWWHGALQELPVVTAVVALDQLRVPGWSSEQLTSYRPLSLSTWRWLSLQAFSPGESSIKLHAKSEPRSKAACPWKSTYTPSAPIRLEVPQGAAQDSLEFV